MPFEIILSVLLGIGLAAACGFRVFLPLFAVSILSKFGLGHFGIAESFAWMGSTPAILTFGIASVIELFAYYIPFIDNLLDTMAVPLAAVAGTLISMSTMIDMEPLMQWSIALIAGGGVAGLIKGSSAATRAASSVTTAGLGNPILTTVETGGSILLTLTAWFIPILSTVLLGILLLMVLGYLFKRKTNQRSAVNS